jgi:HK97 gp10 family phage protein
MKVEIENLEAVVNLLENTFDDEKVKRALGKACAVVEASAKTKAPKGTGELRRSITSEVRTVNGDPVGVVFTPLEYAPYVEYGTGLFAEEGGRTDVPWRYQDDKGEWHTTSGQHPHPYMRPALNENRKKIAQILKEGLVND